MIFDTTNAKKYLMYRSRPGPFCLIFYQEKNDRNKELYTYLKSILQEFHYLPFLRFHFENFTNLYPKKNVISPNHMLIIEKGKEDIIEDLSDFSKILPILQKLRNNLLKKVKEINLYRKKMKSLAKWAPNCHKLKVSTFLQLDEEDADSMYEFPNKTAQLPTPKRRNRRKFELKPSLIHPQNSGIITINHSKLIKTVSKASISHSMNLQTINLTTKNVFNLVTSPNLIVKIPQKIYLHNFNTYNCRFNPNIEKNPKKAFIRKFNYDEPLDLSLSKIDKINNMINRFWNQTHNQKLNLKKKFYNPHIQTNRSFNIHPDNLPKFI